MKELIFTPFFKAVASLEAILHEPKTVIVRDATIQRFEYTYELAIKALKRVLEAGIDGVHVDKLDFRDLCRAAAEAGLIPNPQAWFMYRDSRNSTSHAYDEELAERVYTAAVSFAKDARQLVSELERRV